MCASQRHRVSECSGFVAQRSIDSLYSLPQSSLFRQHTSNMSEASRHILVPKSQPWTSQRVLPHHSKAKRVERLPHTMKAHRLSVLWRIALLLIGSNSARLISGQAHSCYSNSECGSGASCVAGDSSTRVQFCVADPPCGGTTVGNCPVDAVAGQLTCIWRPDIDCRREATGCSMKNGSYGIYKCVSSERCDAYFGNAACSCKYALLVEIHTDVCIVYSHLLERWKTMQWSRKLPHTKWRRFLTGLFVRLWMDGSAL